MESSKNLLEKALKLKPQERIILLEGLLHSLDELAVREMNDAIAYYAQIPI